MILIETSLCNKNSSYNTEFSALVEANPTRAEDSSQANTTSNSEEPDLTFSNLLEGEPNPPYFLSMG